MREVKIEYNEQKRCMQGSFYDIQEEMNRIALIYYKDKQDDYIKLGLDAINWVANGLIP